MALDTAELFTFIGATQADEWEELVRRNGGDPDLSQRRFVERLARQIDERGTIDVLRHGVDDLGDIDGLVLDVAFTRRGIADRQDVVLAADLDAMAGKIEQADTAFGPRARSIGANAPRVWPEVARTRRTARNFSTRCRGCRR